MPTKIKMRSVSVEDLGNIVKHMIDGVLEDNDQVAKLRQAVFKEYYSKKMEELKEEKAKLDADYKLNEKSNDSQINKSDSFRISHTFENGDDTQPENIETVNAHPRFDPIDDLLCDDNLAEQSNSHEISIAKFNGAISEDRLHSEASVTKSSKSSAALQNSQKTDEKTSNNSIINELDTPVVHVMRRQKYVRVPQKLDVNVENIQKLNIALGLANQNTNVDLTKPVNDSTRSKENVNVERHVSSNIEIIEWWNSTLRKKALEQNNVSENLREIPIQFKSKGEIAFEKWKKDKTNTYHRLFREEQERKRREQTAKAKQNEKKEAANEAYLYWKRQQDARQKLKNTRKRILAQMESQKLESSEKRTANCQAFKVWKRQKDIKLRERKLYMMAYSNEQSYPQQQAKPQKPKPGINVAFNMWLDQLDCVLHQKYLRERRYLVRSFYCQPAYFGTAALCSR